MARVLFALLLAAATAGQASAQAARFVFKAGQVLNYKVEQQTHAVEVTSEGKSETTTRMTLTKRWQVLAVDEAGVATLQHSLTALRLETTPSTGETMLFDSADPDKGDPKLREQLSRYVGVPLSTLRVDATGRVVEVKKSDFGPASRFEAEPPFLLVFTAGAEFKPQKGWERTYNITQEPPLGTGEKYEAHQRYTCTKVEGAGAAVSVTTELKTQPEAMSERVPLLQMQPEGTVVFDTVNGRTHSARLNVKKELKGHAGEGSSYSLESTYAEQYLGDR
jgi:hypothetical protein